MASETTSNSAQDTTRPPSGGWTDYVSAFSRTFFGERNARPSRIEEAPAVMQDATPAEPTTSASEAVQHLARTIEHFESLLESLEQRTNGAPAPEDRVALSRGEQDVLQRLDDALTHLGSEAARMSEGAAQLSTVAFRLQENLSSVSNVLERSHEIEQVSAHEPPSSEPRFAANGRPVDVVLTGVPGFQGLMDVQRALASMASAEAASVVGYRNGEATLEVLLRDAVTAQEIVDALRVQTGHTLLVEEAHPEDLKLRLRFAQ